MKTTSQSDTPTKVYETVLYTSLDPVNGNPVNDASGRMSNDIESLKSDFLLLLNPT